MYTNDRQGNRPERMNIPMFSCLPHTLQVRDQSGLCYPFAGSTVLLHRLV